jgi:hypothetical protein
MSEPRMVPEPRRGEGGDRALGYLTPAEYKATLSEGRSPATPARADQEEHGHDGPTTGAILQ